MIQKNLTCVSLPLKISMEIKYDELNLNLILNPPCLFRTYLHKERKSVKTSFFFCQKKES